MQLSSPGYRFIGLAIGVSLNLGAALSQDDAAGNVRLQRQRTATIPSTPMKVGKPAPAPVLPPLPEGVAELKFQDFFQVPVGPRGLELTDKIKSLDGKRVRILGFQVVEAVSVCNADPRASLPAARAKAMIEASVPGRMLLTATQQVMDFNHYGLCDDLPPQVLFVTVPEYFGQPVPHTPGPMLLTGTLSVGNKQEPDGRISVVRLTLDPRAKAVDAQPSPTLPPEAAPASTKTTTPPTQASR